MAAICKNLLSRLVFCVLSFWKSVLFRRARFASVGFVFGLIFDGLWLYFGSRNRSGRLPGGLRKKGQNWIPIFIDFWWFGVPPGPPRWLQKRVPMFLRTSLFSSLSGLGAKLAFGSLFRPILASTPSIFGWVLFYVCLLLGLASAPRI